MRKGCDQGALKVEDGDIVFFAATEWERACTILGRVRLDAAQLLVKREKLVIDPSDYKFLWVIEFPLMLFDEEQNRFVASAPPIHRAGGRRHSAARQ